MPLPKPKKGTKKIRSLSRSRAGPPVPTDAGAESAPEENKEPGVTEKPECPKVIDAAASLQVLEEETQIEKSSASSVQPGAVTRMSEEEGVPKVDKANLVTSCEEEELQGIADQPQPIQIATNLPEPEGGMPKQKSSSEEKPASSNERVEMIEDSFAKPVQLFKSSLADSAARRAMQTSQQLPSTRYNEEEECSLVEQSLHDQK